jgi:aminopeptidase N
MPCQDTPYVKFTYSAEVDADADFTVLLSAISCGTPVHVPGTSLVIYKGLPFQHQFQIKNVAQKRHKYEQKVTIPSYLLAIVVAKISSRVVSPRCKVWSEEINVDAAAWEFNQV